MPDCLVLLSCYARMCMNMTISTCCTSTSYGRDSTRKKHIETQHKVSVMTTLQHTAQHATTATSIVTATSKFQHLKGARDKERERESASQEKSRADGRTRNIMAKLSTGAYNRGSGGRWARGASARGGGTVAPPVDTGGSCEVRRTHSSVS